ncbi:hypothetical protein B0H19DRAFT_476887, partial [Mycena capillaripes]
MKRGLYNCITSLLQIILSLSTLRFPFLPVLSLPVRSTVFLRAFGIHLFTAKMLTTSLFALLSAGASIAAPITRRTFTNLDAAATAEAQVRDNTATRAFSAVPIKTSTGLCLSVDPNSGDFRENLTPVATVECNGSANQTWDVITAGVHNNVPGQALIVSALTQACLNFDARRAPGNQVILFSCGGRADGGGLVADSQQFAFTSGASPIPLVPLSG